MHFRAVILALSIFATVGAAHAQSALDAQLAKAMKPLESKGQQHLGKPGTKPPGTKPSAAAKPSWSVDNDGSKADQPCGMTFVARDKVMGYIGPYKDWKDSYFFVGGPEVPATAKVKKVKVTLATGGDSPQTVKAMHFPVKDGAPVILFQLTNFAAALDGMDDVESVSVTMNGASVFDGNWTGGFAAREKVRACLLKVK
ncbi:hypothetical protein [Sphingorhabdus sp.]|jgi:hypothetical protein|uniref:hypothetical protein n=1 Tax=Sphingorhabdus sp. TaxID=1902408 RepID=UPI002C4A533F|nr:hypothetical protein [Sphingorhabdus sp.]HMT41649.1 hypothetical protein [Sphingorhabdus sp.]